MRIVVEADIAAPPELVWEVVSDPARALEYMVGITRWEPDSEHDRGLGSRFRMLMRVGAADVGSLVEVIEWREGRDLAWTSLTGIDQRGRWRIRPRDGKAHVEFRLAYGVAGGGLFGWLAERAAVGQVRRQLRASIIQLKRMCEQEQLRRTAQERRAERTKRKPRAAASSSSSSR